MLSFDSNGLLIPDHNIQSDIEEFEKIFVADIQSVSRNDLFDNYINYSNSLKTLLNGGRFTQWIDGSFVTKKANPNDIDLVTFIDFNVAETFRNELKDYKYPFSMDIFGVDAYLVKVFPPGHRNYLLYQSDRIYWMDLFSKTARNRIGNRLKKGFLEINM